jgi:hypothetical protein
MKHASPGLDERAITCARHRTTFYALFPRQWGAGEVLNALADHFREHGHRHVAFETIDLVPVAVILAAARPRRCVPPGLATRPGQAWRAS